MAKEKPTMNRNLETKLRDLWWEARDLNLGTTAEIDILQTPPSPLHFLRNYVSPNKPCIISASAYTATHWPAVSQSLWDSDPHHLPRSLPSNHSVSLHLTPHGRADSLVPHNHKIHFVTACVRSVNFADALHLISDSSSRTSVVVAYAQQQNDCFRSEYSPLADCGDVEADIPWATEAFGCPPEAVNLWIGNERSVTSFHKDHYENLYVVVTGQKHFLLLPPTEVHRLYVREYPAASYREEGDGELRLEVEEPERLVPWCSVDPYPLDEEEVERQRRCFPLFFEGPAPFSCTLNAGDMLYLPSMWFHHVRQTPDRNGRTIAINYWYDMQFDIKYAYFNFLQSIDEYQHRKGGDGNGCTLSDACSDEDSLSVEQDVCTVG